MSLTLPAWPLGIWLSLSAAIGAVAGLRLSRVTLRLPARMEADWQRDARDMLGLAPNEDPVDLGPSWLPGFSLAIAGLTSLLTAAVLWRFGPTWPALASMFFTWCLIALAGIDARTHLLPDQLTLPLLWLGLLVALPGPGMFVNAHAAILGAVLGYAALWCPSTVHRLLIGTDGMGGGDFKLLAALGAWTGPVALLPILLIASAIGFAYKSMVVLLGRHERGTPFVFPFGPCLAIGGWTWLIAGAWVRSHWGFFA